VRIAHVVATYPPYLGGTGNVAYHNAIELARLGHTVEVYTATAAGPPGWRDAPEVTVHRLGVPFRVGNAPLTPGLLGRLRGYDLVHLHWPYMFGSELTWLAARLNRQAYVLTYHIDLIGQGSRAPLFSAYQAIWAPRLIRDARAVFAVSLDHFGATFGAGQARRYGTRVREVANGVDLSNFAPGDRSAARARIGLPNQGSLALFVAALDRAHYYKGLDLLVDAVASLPDVGLVVVGDGDLRADYEADVQRRGLAGRVRFAGAVRHDALPDYYRSADVTVLPSTNTESFGLVLAESIACATPIVASDLPGVRSVVDDGRNGYLVPVGSRPELAAAIARVAADPSRRDELGRNGRQKAEQRYDWRQIARSLEREYAAALERAWP
jgi:glycosyltransferase involved in cell wall biosynthesis